MIKIPVDSDIAAVVRYMFIGKTFNHYAADIYFKGEHIGMIHVLDREVSDDDWWTKAHGTTTLTDKYFDETVFAISDFFLNEYELIR